jgi:hypothetical protein
MPVSLTDRTRLPSDAGAGVLAHVVLLEIGHRELDRDSPFGRDRVASVHHQVHENLLDLRSVRLDTPQPFGGVDSQLDPRDERASDEAFDSPHHCGGINDFADEDGAAPVREQLARQLGGRARSDEDSFHVLAGGAFRAVERNLALPQHRGEQVVEVVRDSRGELPDRFHPLCVAEPLFGLLARAHVDGENAYPLRDRLDA